MPCGSMPKGAEVGEATKMTTWLNYWFLYLQMLVFPWIWISDRILEIQLPQRRHRFGPIAEVPGHLVAPGIANSGCWQGIGQYVQRQTSDENHRQLWETSPGGNALELRQGTAVDFTGFKRWVSTCLKHQRWIESPRTDAILRTAWVWIQRSRKKNRGKNRRSSVSRMKALKIVNESTVDEWNPSILLLISPCSSRDILCWQSSAIFSRSWTPNITWNHQFWVKS